MIRSVAKNISITIMLHFSIFWFKAVSKYKSVGKLSTPITYGLRITVEQYLVYLISSKRSWKTIRYEEEIRFSIPIQLCPKKFKQDSCWLLSADLSMGEEWSQLLRYSTSCANNTIGLLGKASSMSCKESKAWGPQLLLVSRAI